MLLEPRFTAGFSVILPWLLVAFMLGGCAGGTAVGRKAPRVTADQSLVSLYLSTTGVATEKVELTVDGLALLIGDVWIDLPAEAQRLQRHILEGRQLLLGVGAFPVGECRRLRFNVKEVRLPGQAGPEIAEQSIDLPLARPLALSGSGSVCLFVDWHLQSPLPGEAPFVPRFSAHGQELPLGQDLAYVVCDDINTLYLVRTDTNFVTAALGLPGPLGELAVDSRRRRLYVLSTGDRAIHVFSSANTQYLERIPLSITVGPRNLCLSADGAFAYVSDPATNRVLKVDLERGVVAAQEIVGFRPERLHYFVADGRAWLAVSSPTAQRVYLLNGDSLALLREIPAGLETDSLLFYNDQLYVAERGSSSVSAFDYRSGRQLSRITVGWEPVYLLGFDNKVFVSNQKDAALSVFHSGQNSTARRIPLDSSPFVMAASERRRQLYIAHREAHSLSVLDLSSERLISEIMLGGSPYFMAILE